MTQTNVFDPHAIIQWLAKQEQRPLLDSSGTGIWRCPLCRQCSDQPHTIDHTNECQRASFAALRVACRGIPIGHNAALTDTLLGPGVFPHNYHSKVCCSKRGWIPEPDVRAACWEILKANPKIANEVYSHSMSGAWYWYDNKNAPNHKGWTRVDTAEEALLRAVEAGVKEHKA